MLSLLTSIIPRLFKIGDKLIVDKDKKMEYAFKVQEMTFNLMEKIITMKTIPWVDAFVKILMTFVTLARPLGSFALTLIGLYSHYKQLPIPETVNYALDGAFPAWMGLRERDKSHKRKLKERGFDDEDF